MISGTVNDELQPVVPLTLRDASGQTRDVEAVIDTGFNGYLTLPSNLTGTLGLPWVARHQGLVADGTVHTFDVYAATVVWDGKDRLVETEIVEAQPLIGMAFLLEHDLWIRVRRSGAVEVRAIP